MKLDLEREMLDLRKEVELPGVRLVLLGKHKTSLCWMGVPMQNEDVDGIIAIGSYRPNAFGQGDLELLTSLAQHAAQALHNTYEHQAVELSAQLDSLTGVYNHGNFLRILQQQADEASLERQPLSLIMLDIDYFKAYNDSYGRIVNCRAADIAGPAGNRICGEQRHTAGKRHHGDPAGIWCHSRDHARHGNPVHLAISSQPRELPGDCEATGSAACRGEGTSDVIEVRQVQTVRERHRFLGFPWQLYHNDPLWVPPIFSDREKVTDPARGHFFESGYADFFMAYKDGKLAGTI
jgi:hypothetical protein